MKSPFDTHRFVALDGLRGVAAFIVVFRHFSMGSEKYMLPLSFLAVDFFFVLSGFVLEPTFTVRGKPVPLGSYLLKRVLRLWPTYLLGLAVAVLGVALYPQWSFPHTIREAVGAVLLLPLVGNLSQYAIFPLMGPAWSLFAEFWIANLLFAAFYARLPRNALYVGVVLLALAMCYLTIRQGSVDFGFTWRRWPEAVPRVLFSFAVGCALRRWRLGKNRLNGIWFFALGALLVGVFALPVDRLSGWQSLSVQLAALVLILPAFVFAGSYISTGPVTRWIAERSGELSYPLYVLHYGLGRVASWAWHPPVVLAPLATFAIALLFLPIAWLVSFYFERPLRGFAKIISARRTAAA
jgi:peptidoglycan/LPS O-acetylase OafA/YrhL